MKTLHTCKNTTWTTFFVTLITFSWDLKQKCVKQRQVIKEINIKNIFINHVHSVFGYKSKEKSYQYIQSRKYQQSILCKVGKDKVQSAVSASERSPLIEQLRHVRTRPDYRPGLAWLGLSGPNRATQGPVMLKLTATADLITRLRVRHAATSPGWLMPVRFR